MKLSDKIKTAVLQLVCRFASNLINSIHNFHPQAEPDAEMALRQSITKYMLVRDTAVRDMVEQKIENAVQTELGNFAAQLQDAICDGMNIECSPETSMAELFAMIDTSISKRVAMSQNLHFQTFKVEEVK